MNFYVDLDNTLISGEPGTNKVVVYKRPGAHRFLNTLRGLGRVTLVTHGTEEHAYQALRVTGLSRHFKRLICREQLDRVTPGVGPLLAAPGFMFDDMPVGHWLYDLKATALGIGPDLWIQVEKFSSEFPDRSGLRKALAELARRVKKSA